MDHREKGEGKKKKKQAVQRMLQPAYEAAEEEAIRRKETREQSIRTLEKTLEMMGLSKYVPPVAGTYQTFPNAFVIFLADMVKDIKEINARGLILNLLRNPCFCYPTISGQKAKKFVDIVEKIPSTLEVDPYGAVFEPRVLRAAKHSLSLLEKLIGLREKSTSFFRPWDITLEEVAYSLNFTRNYNEFPTSKADGLVKLQCNETTFMFDRVRARQLKIRDLLDQLNDRDTLHHRAGPDDYGGSLSDEQTSAVRKMHTSPLTFLTGFPGTGKTHTVMAYCTHLKKSRQCFKIVCPTHKAKQKLVNLFGSDRVTTACSLRLEIDRESSNPPWVPDAWEHEGTEGTKKKKDGPIDPEHTTLLFDEASMLTDLDLCSILKHWVPKTRRPIIFVGDPDQLPPVNAPMIFADMLDRYPECGAHLADVRRSDRQALLDLFANIRSGTGMIPEDSTGSLQVRHKDNACFEKDPGFFDGGSVLLTFTRVDVDAYNRTLSNLHRSHLPKTKIADYGFPVYVYTDDRKDGKTKRSYPDIHVFQGMRVYFSSEYKCLDYRATCGTVVSFAAKKSSTCSFCCGTGQPDAEHVQRNVEVKIDDGPTIIVCKESLCPAYALTVHKAQGSEWPHVYYAVNRSGNLIKRLVYTAVTRAKDRLTILHDGRCEDGTLRKYLEKDPSVLGGTLLGRPDLSGDVDDAGVDKDRHSFERPPPKFDIVSEMRLQMKDSSVLGRPDLPGDVDDLHSFELPPPKIDIIYEVRPQTKRRRGSAGRPSPPEPARRRRRRVSSSS